MRAKPLLVLLLLLGACAERPGPAGGSAAPARWQGELPIAGPWLRDELPSSTLLYLRVPHPTALVAMPKDNDLDALFLSDANVRNVQAIESALIDTVLSEAPGAGGSALRLVLAHLRSPLEIVVRLGGSPSALIGVTTDFDSADALATAVAEAGLALAAPVDTNGVAEVTGLPVKLHLRLDAGTGRLLMNAGPNVTTESFERARASLTASGDHPLRVTEADIDASGQGLFLWMDAPNALPVLSLLTPPNLMQTVADLRLERFGEVALGWGVANRKSRIAAVVTFRDASDRGLVPAVDPVFAARSVGEPGALITLAMPDAEEYRRLESTALALLPGDSRGDWATAMEAMTDTVGFEVADLFAALGPDVSLVFDRAGDYLAVRIADTAAWDKVLAGLESLEPLQLERREIDGRSYVHMTMPDETALLGVDAGEASPLASRLLGRNHLYWVREGDYLYIASVPQMLYSRAALGADTVIGDWLADTQRIDTRHALLTVSWIGSGMNHRLYGAYIEVLQYLADVSEADFDVWSMPTAHALGLPRDGTLGLRLAAAPQRLTGELTFEHNPIEFLGGAAGIATVGIVAAIAIPAYQDYTVRARVGGGLLAARPTRDAVGEFYRANGRFPDAGEAAALAQGSDVGDGVNAIVVEPDSGRIAIELADDIAGGGHALWLSPEAGPDGGLNWRCTASLAEKLLPGLCRDER